MTWTPIDVARVALVTAVVLLFGVATRVSVQVSIHHHGVPIGAVEEAVICVAAMALALYAMVGPQARAQGQGQGQGPGPPRWHINENAA